MSHIVSIATKLRDPAAIGTATGAVQFDNLGGHWGDAQQFDRLLQAHAVEKTRIECASKATA